MFPANLVHGHILLAIGIVVIVTVLVLAARAVRARRAFRAQERGAEAPVNSSKGAAAPQDHPL